MSTAASSRTIIPEPLTAAAFSAYGELIEPARSPGRRTHVEALGHDESADTHRPCVLSTTTAEPTTLPLTVSELERHPHSSQTFLPISDARWLVIVADSLAADRVRAFEVPPRAGVTIGRNTWHHGLTVLDAPASFAVVMWKSGSDDDEFRSIDQVTVTIRQQ
jgi:ureidoglycolate lyase